jgi:hypothetical protein
VYILHITKQTNSVIWRELFFCKSTLCDVKHITKQRTICNCIKLGFAEQRLHVKDEEDRPGRSRELVAKKSTAQRSFPKEEKPKWNAFPPQLFHQAESFFTHVEAIWSMIFVNTFLHPLLTEQMARSYTLQQKSHHSIAIATEQGRKNDIVEVGAI